MEATERAYSPGLKGVLAGDCLEQADANVLIRPDVRYVGPAERHLPS